MRDDVFGKDGWSEERFAWHVLAWEPAHPEGGESPYGLDDDDLTPDRYEDHEDVSGSPAGGAEGDNEDDEPDEEGAGEVEGGEGDGEEQEMRDPVVGCR